MRYRFDISLRNALSTGKSGSAQQSIENSVPGTAAQSSKIRRIARSAVGPIARRLKRYLVGDVEVALEALRTKVDFQMVSLHNKVDDLHRLSQLLQHLKQAADEQAGHRVNSDRKLDDISLHVRSPVRVDATTYAVRTADGFVFVPDKDIQLLLLLIDAGPAGLEPGTRTVIRNVLRPGMTFVDVGAHIGLLTIAAARAVGSTGKVIALEPTDITFSMLQRAAEVNGVVDYVRMERVAAGAAPGKTKFYIHSVLGHNSAVVSDGALSEVDVEVIPLDEIIPDGTRVDLIKIDVEGAELEVLKGMSRILKQNPGVALIAEFGMSHLRQAGYSPEAWFGAFEDAGFKGHLIDELTGELRPLGPSEHPHAVSANILFKPRNG